MTQWRRILATICSIVCCTRVPAFAQPATPEQPSELVLTVTDAASQQPIANAAVQISSSFSNGPAELKTGAAGKIHFALPPTPAQIFARVRADGHVPVTLNWLGGRMPAAYELKLQAGVTVGGQVVDEAGLPVPDASIFLSSRPFDVSDDGVSGVIRDGDLLIRPGVAGVELKTDADGRWTYAGMPAAFASADVGVTHPDFISHAKNSGTYELRHLDDRQGLLDKTVTLLLDKGQPVRGSVTDLDGLPLAEARVHLGPEGYAPNAVPEMMTDDQGRFALQARPGEKVTLTARLQGHGPEQIAFTMPDAAYDATIKLGPKHSLKGHVVDDAGKPVAGAYLVVETWRGTRVLAKQMPVDPQGRFSWSNAPADEVLVYAQAPGYATQRDLPMVWSKENVVTLKPAMAVEGTVFDNETGKLVTHFTVVPGIDFGEMNPMHWARSEMDTGIGTPQTIDAPDGHFRRPFGDSYPTVGLRIEAPGYLPAEVRGLKTNGPPKPLTFRLKPGKDVSAIVTDTAGKPVANAEVRLAGPGGYLRLNAGRFEPFEREARTTTTDAAGRFRFTPESGEYRVAVVTDAGYAILTPADVVAEKPVVLQPWAVVTGTAYVGTKPDAGKTFGLVSQDDRSYRPGVSPPAVVMESQPITTDASGHFRVDRVTAGPHAITLREAVSADGWTEWPVKAITTVAGQTLDVRLGGVGRPVVGRIDLPVALKGQPWGGVNAYLVPAPDRPPRPAGYAAMTPEQQSAWQSQWLMTAEGKAWIARSLKGRAGNANTMPPHVHVAVAADGSFRAEDVEAGPYDLVVQFYRPPTAGQPGGRPMADVRAPVDVPPPDHGPQSDEPVIVPPVAARATP